MTSGIERGLDGEFRLPDGRVMRLAVWWSEIMCVTTPFSMEMSRECDVLIHGAMAIPDLGLRRDNRGDIVILANNDNNVCYRASLESLMAARMRLGQIDVLSQMSEVLNGFEDAQANVLRRIGDEALHQGSVSAFDEAILMMDRYQSSLMRLRQQWALIVREACRVENIAESTKVAHPIPVMVREQMVLRVERWSSESTLEHIERIGDPVEVELFVQRKRPVV